MKDNESTDREDDVLLAFRYVSGELSEPETNAFELRMLDDQSLCECVVDVTKIACAVGAVRTPVESTTVSVRAVTTENGRSRGFRNVLATMVAATCCVVIVWVSSGVLIDHRDTAVSQNSNEVRADLLIDVWAETASKDRVDVSDEPESVANDLDVPDWLIAAVTIGDLETSESDRPIDDFMPDDMEL